MKPYFEQGGITIYHADSRDAALGSEVVRISDPPYNVNYGYDKYSDNLTEDEYRELIKISLQAPSVVIHYPEEMFLIASSLNVKPSKCVAWTYNAHTPRKWRMISWFGISPNFDMIKQQYKNLNDRRIIARLESGSEGASLYDWWHEEQVKNVSSQKTEHPCQIPIQIMKNVIGITHGECILDPFMGSGTTLVAAKLLNRRAIGIEISEKYCEIAANRILNTNPLFDEPQPETENLFEA